MTTPHPQPDHTELEPDRAQIKQHLEFLFGEAKGDENARIEIAYTGVNTGQLNRAQYFAPGDIEDAVEFVAQTNERPGVNVYVGACLRNDQAPPFGRSSIREVQSASAVWADIDDGEAANLIKDKYKDLTPGLVVVTGRQPNKRLQLWWKLDSPTEDRDSIKEALAGLKDAMGGDAAVVDPARVMRIGGTVSWPKKEGRVAEMTEVHQPPVSAPSDIEEIKKAYPPTFIGHGMSGHQVLDDGKPREMITGKLKIADILEKTKEPHQWHQNMRDAIASMVSSGWSDQQIRLAAGPYCEAGVADHDLDTLITTARSKWDKPDPGDNQIERHEAAIEHAKKAEEENRIRTNIHDWNIDQHFTGDAPPIRWLVEGIFPLGIPALLAAAGGVGKSFTALDLCINIAKPNKVAAKRIMGGDIVEHGTCVFITAEDSKDSVHRRINSLIESKDVEEIADKLKIMPMPEVGGTQFLVSDTAMLGCHTTPFFDDLKQQLSEIEDLKLVVIDPLQAFVGADVTSRPEAGQFMWSAFSNIAAETGATFLCTHHMRKDGMKNIKSAADAREAIRGSTALVDGARLAYAMWQMPDDTGEYMAQTINEVYEPHRFVAGAVVKVNDEANHDITGFYREESGLLIDRGSVDIKQSIGLTENQAEQVLKAIKEAWNKGQPYSASPQSGKYLIPFICRSYKIDKTSAKKQLSKWLNPEIGMDPILSEKGYEDAHRNRRNGLYVNYIP